MNSEDIRKNFIEFFKEKDHKEFKSSSLIPNDDSLLFTTAGMVQMVPFLLRLQDIKHSRVLSIQKSFRTVDINNIGNDGRHLTFFEMLGSWSFGDYYKKEAIEFAYTLLTERFKMSEDKLWATIFKGNKDITRDNDSYEIWSKLISKSRIVELVDDNFWGPTGLEGACGPSTEIYYDLGENICSKDKYECCLEENCRPGCDCDRFLEIWNAGVFMEYYKDQNGFRKLPYTNVDTGAGLERIALVLQGKNSVFETDLFSPIIEKIKEKIKIPNEKSVNIIADHIRGITFLIADSLFPSNEYRGYVLRRLIRRAMVQVIIMKGDFPFLSDISEVVIDNYKDVYKELGKNKEHIMKVINDEEILFQKTLDKGIEILDKMIEYKGGVSGKEPYITGENLFKLHDTYGLNIDLIEDIFITKKITMDIAAFNFLMKKQKERSRVSSSFTVGKSIEVELKDIPSTKFLGYDTLTTKGSRVLYVLNMDKDVQFVLDRTSFFAESGGQIGDSGKVLGNNININIENTRKTKNDVFIHIGKYTKNSIKIKEGDLLDCFVDEESRIRAGENHSAIHLFNKAIKIVLGDQVVQKGALITSDKMRFDFNFERPLNNEEIAELERIVNIEIEKNPLVVIEEVSYDEAKKRGIDLLFDERYAKDKKLRLVKIGDFSEELCGGTHKGSLGNIGTFKIIKQESVGKGIRRIRAELKK